MSTDVQQITTLIDRLPEADRLILEEHLVSRAEDAWQKAADSDRAAATNRGIDQQSIDDAVAKHRTGT